jgi:hypothetical protein
MVRRVFPESARDVQEAVLKLNKTQFGLLERAYRTGRNTAH